MDIAHVVGVKRISPSDKDDRMSYICDAADAAGIVVFTIAFEIAWLIGRVAYAANAFRLRWICQIKVLNHSRTSLGKHCSGLVARGTAQQLWKL